MIWLVAGVFLWTVAHLFKRIAPDQRASLGDAGKGLVALLVIGSIVLMVLGFRASDAAIFWDRHPMTVGINNLLMLIAVYLMVASSFPVRVKSIIRHPQLASVKIWALAHLLVNGDTASFILFGGLFLWALVSVIVINRAGKPALPQIEFSAVKEGAALAISLIVFGGIAWLHGYLGYQVFG
jgi:uncharacterized membrane protein